ncbi:Serine/threonine-protein kinase ppk11, partial [Clarias magur]
MPSLYLILMPNHSLPTMPRSKSVTVRNLAQSSSCAHFTSRHRAKIHSLSRAKFCHNFHTKHPLSSDAQDICLHLL